MGHPTQPSGTQFFHFRMSRVGGCHPHPQGNPGSVPDARAIKCQKEPCLKYFLSVLIIFVVREVIFISLPVITRNQANFNQNENEMLNFIPPEAGKPKPVTTSIGSQLNLLPNLTYLLNVNKDKSTTLRESEKKTPKLPRQPNRSAQLGHSVLDSVLINTCMCW